MFGLFNKSKSIKDVSQDRRENKGLFSDNMRFLSQQKGFVVYRGEDLLELKEVKPLVTQLKNAFGGDIGTYEKHLYPSLRVFAAYCQFLPASEAGNGQSHHIEPLGLLVHSLETSIAVMNYLRNCNVNFGVNPDKRAEHTLAYKLTCTLAALLHDVGKINDWKVITQTADGKEHRYAFVRSIPEFLAKQHGLPVNEVYANPGDDKSSLYKPKYRILGARNHRSKKHEIIGNDKKNLFISTATEQLIADASEDLYEQLHFYSYQELIKSDLIHVSGSIAEVVAKADRQSAQFWTDTHSSGEIHSLNSEPPVFNTASLDEDEEIVITRKVNSNCSDKVPNPEVAVKTPPAVGAKDAYDTASSVRSVQSDEINLDGVTPSRGEKHLMDTEINTGEVKLISDSDDFTLPKERVSQVYPFFVAALNLYTSDPKEMCVNINQNNDAGFISTLGVETLESEKDLLAFLRFDAKSQAFLHKWIEYVEKFSGVDLFKDLPQDCQGKDYLHKVLMLLKAYGVIKPFNSHKDLFRIEPSYAWQGDDILYYDAVLLKRWQIAFSQDSPLYENFSNYRKGNVLIENVKDFLSECKFSKNTELKLLNCEATREFQISSDKLHKEREVIKNKTGEKIQKTISVFKEQTENVNELVEKKVKALENNQNIKIKHDNKNDQRINQSSRAVSLSEMLKPSDNKPVKNHSKKESDFDANKPLSEEFSLDLPKNNLSQEEIEELKNTDDGKALGPTIDEMFNVDTPFAKSLLTENKIESSNISSENISGLGDIPVTDEIKCSSSQATPVSSEMPVKKVLYADPLELQKAIIPQVNSFKADLIDQKKGMEIQERQLPYYFSQSDTIKLKNLSEDERKQRLNEVTQKIKDKLVDKNCWPKIHKEIDLGLRRKASYISFRIIAGLHYYAAFNWDSYNQSAKTSKGVTMLATLISNNLVPLAVHKSKTDLKDELEYFSCVLLDPLITEYMILLGAKDAFKVEIKRWTATKGKATAKDVLRYFEHLVMQCPLGETVYGYKPSGSPLIGMKIRYDALIKCCLDLKCEGYESQRYKLLNIKNQITPPYIWKDGEDVVISFFSKEDLLANRNDAELVEKTFLVQEYKK